MSRAYSCMDLINSKEQKQAEVKHSHLVAMTCPKKRKYMGDNLHFGSKPLDSFVERKRLACHENSSCSQNDLSSACHIQQDLKNGLDEFSVFRGDYNDDIYQMISKDGLRANEDSVEEWKKFDSLILKFMNEFVIPGISISISYKGKHLYTQAYGWAKKGVPLRSFHVCRIASVTKILTAIGIMKLVEENRIKLTDKVFGPKGHLCRFEVPARGDRRLYQITVKHLLQHSGGWDRDIVGDPCFWPHVAMEMGIDGPVMQEDLITFMMSQKLQFTPGSKYAYSNYGYILLGRIIEAVTNMNYETYIQNLISALDVTGLRLGKTKKEYAYQDEVEYFPTPSQISVDSVYPGEGKVPAPYGGFCMEAADSDGGWVASPADLLKILHSLESNASSRVLKPSTVKLMLKKPRYGRGSTWYGLGIDVAWYGKAWEHGGHVDGATSGLTRDKDGYSWAVLCNYWPADSDYTSFISYCLNQVKGRKRPSVHLLPHTDSISNQGNSILKLRIPHCKLYEIINYHEEKGYRVTWISGYNFHERTFFNVIWTKTEAKYLFACGLTLSEIKDKIKEAETEGLFVKSVDSYLLDGVEQFSLVCDSSNQVNSSSVVISCNSMDSLKSSEKILKSHGKYIKCIMCQCSDSGTSVTALFVADSNPTWWQIDMDSDSFQKQCDRQSSYGHMPIYVKTYIDTEQAVKFCGVWSSPGAYRYTSEHDISRYRLLHDITLTSSSGFYPYCIAGYEEEHNHKFAAVCVKNV